MEYITRFLQGLKVAPSDEKLGNNATMYPAMPQSEMTRKSMQAEDPNMMGPNFTLSTSEQLMEFRMLVGIISHKTFKAPRGFDKNHRPIFTEGARPVPNLGIYPTVVDHEFKNKINYKRMSRLINFCLGLQIIVAATLTALGAASGNHVSVTIFGAINTVIAGFLTFLKGSGLPNRLKFYAHEWYKIRLYIEERERDLGMEHHDIDVHKEVNIIRQMFEQVKADVEANTPDRFVGSGGSLNRSTAIQQALSVAGGEETLRGMLRHAQSKVSDLRQEVGSATSSEVERARGRLADDVTVLKSKLAQKLKEVEDLEKDVENSVSKTATQGVRDVKDMAEDRVKEVADFEKNLESSGRLEVNIEPSNEKS